MPTLCFLAGVSLSLASLVCKMGTTTHTQGSCEPCCSPASALVSLSRPSAWASVPTTSPELGCGSDSSFYFEMFTFVKCTIQWSLVYSQPWDHCYQLLPQETPPHQQSPPSSPWQPLMYWHLSVLGSSSRTRYFPDPPGGELCKRQAKPTPSFCEQEPSPRGQNAAEARPESPGNVPRPEVPGAEPRDRRPWGPTSPAPLPLPVQKADT